MIQQIDCTICRYTHGAEYRGCMDPELHNPVGYEWPARAEPVKQTASLVNVLAMCLGCFSGYQLAGQQAGLSFPPCPDCGGQLVEDEISQLMGAHA